MVCVCTSVVTAVNISVHDTEDSPALATRDGYNFIIHEEIGVDVLSPFVIRMLRGECSLYRVNAVCMMYM